MIVETTDDAALLRRALKGVRRVALDTESNSLHAYSPHVCLVQLSTDWEDFLIDPLKLDMAQDGAFLGELCADTEVEVVFPHAVRRSTDATTTRGFIMDLFPTYLFFVFGTNGQNNPLNIA